jgi:hypothetical protein
MNQRHPETNLYAGPGAGAGNNTGTGISVTGNETRRYLILPSASWKKITKDELEKNYRTYITYHYHMCICQNRYYYTDHHLELASADKDRQAPFTRIAEKQSAFIAAKYLPRAISLNDPQTMKREEMIKLFEHIGARQETCGVQDAFRFKAVLTSRKKGTICDTKYP